jgi:ribosomal protein S18 acetylase RimI-like enzyme
VAEDIEAVGSLWERLVAHHVALDARLPVGIASGGRRYARRLYDRLSDDYACLLVAVQDERVIGFVLGMIVDLMPDLFEQEVSGFLADIFVEPEMREQGIGRALVQTLAEWFAGRGVQHFEWHVAARNESAVAFWEAIGGEAVMLRMRVQTAATIGNER